MDQRRRLTDDRRATDLRIVALERELAVLLAATGDSPDDEHDPEGATIGFERAQAASLLDAARRHLSELDAAENRLSEGRYGVCEVCSDLIGHDRLEVLPATGTCISCARRGRS